MPVKKRHILIFWFWIVGAAVVFNGTWEKTWAAQLPEMQTLTAEEIKKIGMEYMLSQLSDTGKEVKVEIDYMGVDAVLPKGKIDFNIKNSQNNPRARRVPLLLTINVDGVFKKGLWMTANIKVRSNVIKALHNLERDHIIEYGDVVLESGFYEHNGMRVAQRLEDVIGLKVTRALSDNEPIPLNALIKAPVVNRGDRVMIVAEKGFMKITAPGIVQERGFRGNIVAVQNIESKKIVYAEVVNASLVQVRF